MRDIKFRAIVNEKGINKCWIEGSLVHITKTYKGEEDEQECDIFQIINEDGVGFFIDKNTIGQYTGLKDKNGKEIYEGDIVQILGGEYEQGFYEWDEKVCIKDLIYDGFNLLMTINQIGDKTIEVIGNIYDNPELLKGE